MKKLLCLLATLAAAAALRADDASTAATRIGTCEAILQDFQASPATAIPAEILKNAKALVITNQINAGLIFGFKAGYGVVTVKGDNGRWSIPVLIDAGDASVGLQIGGGSVRTIYVLMDAKSPSLLFLGKSRFGADLRVLAGPHVSDLGTKPVLNQDVFVYTRHKGVYAGVTVKAAFLTRNDGINHAFYGVPYSLPELLYGNYIKTPPSAAQEFIDYVTQIAP